MTIIPKIYCKLLVFLLLYLSPISFIKPQVTIGSLQKPNSGALLDLKEHIDGSSFKGLMLPRVHLSERKTLMDIASGEADCQRLQHTGLTVYNVNPNAPFCAGVFIWTSTIWKRLGGECLPYLTGLQEIDFGIYSAAKTISFTTNQGWSYTTENNYIDVINSTEKVPNTIHTGGDIEEIGEANVSFNIRPTLTPNDPANKKYETKLHFKTEKHPDGVYIEKTIIVKRTVPSRFESLYVSNVIPRTGGNIVASVNTNDKWALNSQTMQAGTFALKSLQIPIGVCDQWVWDGDHTITHAINVHYTNSNTGKVTSYPKIVKQNAPYISALSSTFPTTGNYIPKAGGYYAATQVTGDGNIAFRVYVGTRGGTMSLVSQTPTYTLIRGASMVSLGITIPPNTNPSARYIEVRFLLINNAGYAVSELPVPLAKTDQL